MFKSNLDKEKEDDNERTEEATGFADSPLLQETNLTSVQAVVETEQREVIESTQELDEGLELDDTDQVTDDQFDDEDEEEAEEKSPKSSKLKSC